MTHNPDVYNDYGKITPTCTYFKRFNYLGSMINKAGNCHEDMNYKVSVTWLICMIIRFRLCDKRETYATITLVKIYCTTSAHLWFQILEYKKFERDPTSKEMKTCRMFPDVTKFDHIKNQHIQGDIPIKNAIVDKVKCEIND